MDGWEFRVEQRADPLLAGIPLLAMSADLSAKARAIAADGYIRKPIEFAELLRQLTAIVGRAARQRLAAADRMARWDARLRIAHEINNRSRTSWRTCNARPSGSRVVRPRRAGCPRPSPRPWKARADPASS
jgi:DNA-binding response OmpR family regulator